MAFAQLTFARACATSRRACARSSPSSTTSACARRCRATRWPMPTPCAIGASTRLRQSLIGIARPLYVDEPFGSTCRTPSMRSTPRRSICPWPCSHGRRFSRARQRYGCTRCSICAQHPHVHSHQRWSAARGQRPRSTGARARRLLHHGPRLSRLRPTLPPAAGRQLLIIAPRQGSSSNGAIRITSTAVPAWSATRPSCSRHLLATGLPGPLRRIRFRDPATPRPWCSSPTTSAAGPHHHELYRCRWQVELFFKWIKQHLRIKAFFAPAKRGEDPNLDRGCHLRPDRDRQEARRSAS